MDFFDVIYRVNIFRCLFGFGFFFFEFYPSYILNVDLEDGDFHCYLRD